MAEGNTVINGEEPTVLRNDSQSFSEKPAALAPQLGKEHGSVKPDDGHLTVWLILTSISCFLGSSFQFGYNLGVVNAPKDVRLLFTNLILNFYTCSVCFCSCWVYCSQHNSI